MINLFGGLLVVFGLLAGITFPLETDQSESQGGFAVVELFTAEGCSSCPKADELLREMTDILAKENIQVMGLAFHVTYWNKYGWTDPYSQEQFTERQKKYVSKLEFTQVSTPQIYTPQAIVNGEIEFVGSNPFAFRNNVITAAGKKAAYDFEVEVTDQDGSIQLHYELSREPKNVVLNVAVVEHYLEHFVPRGENKSRTLKHANVVRGFQTIVPERSGDLVVPWPDDLSKEKGSIILFAQNPKTMKVVGASKVDIK